MKFNYITNAFSLNMIDSRLVSRVRFREIDVTQQEVLVYESAVGHVDIAVVMSKQLGMEVPFNRQSLKIDDGNVRVLIGQYKGPRLEEGTTQLPEGSTIEYYELYFEPVAKFECHDTQFVIANIATGEIVKRYDLNNINYGEATDIKHQLNK